MVLGFAISVNAADIDISGAIEVEVGFIEQDSVKSEDISTVTVELGFDAEINENVVGHLLLLFEEDDTDPINVDEAFIVLKPNEQFFLQAGTYVVPFGSYDGLVLSDPLTLSIGETGQSAVTLGYTTGAFTVQAGTFNGDVTEVADTEDKINVLFAAIDYSEQYDSELTVDARLSYISSLADSDGLQDSVSTVNGAGDPAVDGNVAGIGVATTVGFGQFTFIAEYVTAVTEFKASDFGTADDIKPQAFNLEAGYAISDATSVAIRYGGTKDMGVALPEKVVAAAIGHEIYDDTSISAEYLIASFEDDAIDNTTALTFQLAISF